MLNNKLHKKYNDNETLVCKKKCRFNAFNKSVSVHNIALKIQKNESGFPLMRGRNGFLNFFFYLVKIPLNQSPTVLPASSTCPLTSVSKGVSLSVARIRNSEALFPVQLAAICPTSNKILQKPKLPFLYSFLHVHPLVCFLYPFILIIMSCTVVFELSNKKNQVNLD